MNGTEAAEHAFAVCAFLEERQLTDAEAFGVLGLALGNVLAIVPAKPLTPEQLEASLQHLTTMVRTQVQLVQAAMQMPK